MLEGGKCLTELGEYKQASEYDPTNRSVASKVAELDQTIRDRIEATRPKPPLQAMRDRARVRPYFGNSPSSWRKEGASIGTCPKSG